MLLCMLNTSMHNKIKCKLCFSYLPMDSCRGDIEFPDVFAHVASMAVSFVYELICWNIGKQMYAKAS